MKVEKRESIRFKLTTVLVLAACGLFLASCSSTMSTRASRVRLVSAVQAQEVETQCEFLGNVTGTTSFWGYIFSDFGLNEALNQLLDNAAELGATHVFVNLGNRPELRGEAYLCAYCRLADGSADTPFCRGAGGESEKDRCVDKDGTLQGQERCEGAEAGNPAECKEQGGTWAPALTKEECEKQGHSWITEAKTKRICDERGGTWVPKARNRVSCEAKGGEWVINEDVLRLAPSPARGKEKAATETEEE